MSCPGSVAIVTESGSTILSDKYGAVDLCARLYAHGPIKEVEMVRDSYEDEDDAFSDVDEGITLIDLTRRSVLTCDFNLRPPVVKVLLDLLAKRWPGWTFSWANRGLAEFSQAAGIAYTDLVSVVPDALPLKRDDPPNSLFGTLLSVLGNSGVMHATYSSRWVEGALAHGPALLPHLNDVWDTSLPNEADVASGAVIDELNRFIEVWWASPVDDTVLEVLRAAWPGWQVVRQTDGMSAHLRRAGCATYPPLMTVEEARAALQQQFGETSIDWSVLDAGV